MNQDLPSFPHAQPGSGYSGSPDDLAFLAGSGRDLAASLVPAQVAGAIARIAVPYLADWAVVEYGCAESGASYAAGGDAVPESLIGTLAKGGSSEEPHSGTSPGSLARYAGSPLAADDLHALFGERSDAGGLAAGAAVVLPLVAGERSLGCLLLGRRAARGPFSDADMRLAGEFAGRAASALFNAERFRQALERAERAEREREELRQQHREAQERYDSLLESMRRIELRVRRLFEANVIGIVFSSINGTIVEANDAFLQMVGYTREDLHAGAIRWDEMTPPEHLPVSMHAVEELGRLGICTPFEKEYLRKDGSRVPVLLGSALLEGDREHTVGFVLDLSQRKEAEMELKEAKEAAEAASRAKDQFLATLSHELRTPLTPVLASVQALEGEPGLPADLLPYMEIIRRTVELEARLIDDLLDLTRIAKGKLQLNTESVDLHAILQHVREICLGDIRRKNLTLASALDAAEHHVLGDPARLQQVLWNLMQNAVKFTPDGGSIMVHTANPEPGRLRLEVADTGIGIEPHLISRIFDAFEQGEGSINRRFGGLGLGLAISRMLVSGHGGTLSAASPGRDQGATFTMELAIAMTRDDFQVPQQKPEPGREQGARHILLVDDHLDTSMVMKLLLERQGYRVTTADSVASALALADREPFDLLVSDIGLPDGTGLDIMRELRSRQGIRGIALSGFGMEDDVRKSRDAGFADHLIKPVSFKALALAIRAVLEG